MNVMPQQLAQNISDEERRNMSKRGLDCLTGSNASRTPFDFRFKAFESHLRDGAAAPEFSLSRTEALKNPSIQLDMAHRIVLEQWLADLFERFDGIAGHLIPTARASRVKAARTRGVIVPKRRISGVNLENIR